VCWKTRAGRGRRSLIVKPERERDKWKEELRAGERRKVGEEVLIGSIMLALFSDGATVTLPVQFSASSINLDGYLLIPVIVWAVIIVLYLAYFWYP
jgi:hypothetical protein